MRARLLAARLAMLAGMIFCARRAACQSVWRDEAGVGSERELYARVLSLAADYPSPPAIRPSVATTSMPPWHPWRTPADDQTLARARVLRPALLMSTNFGFPWQVLPTGAWQGRGANFTASAGGAARLGPLSLRFEPVVALAENAAFRLEDSTTNFADALRPGSIDEPQRFGTSAFSTWDWGESMIRLNARYAAAGLSNERLFWGPGVHHALLFSSAGSRFPHVFLSTNNPVNTPLGDFEAQLIYGRLEDSRWAPAAPTESRLGSGIIAVWNVRGLPMRLGGARFYHRPWPGRIRLRHLLVPFGSLLFDAQTFAGGTPDNQLASAFFSARLPAADMEIFGEFGKNDRAAGLRDLALETELNSAWLLGMIRAFAVDSIAGRFWAFRVEVANGRVGAIERTRGVATFYEHSPITQGHTARGLLLGTPLIDRSGGSELAVDRWSVAGRIGVSVMQRQMPPDMGEGMPADRARTQWDVRAGGLRFVRGGELSYRLGVVWDLNRFPGESAANPYVAIGWRQAIRVPGR